MSKKISGKFSKREGWRDIDVTALTKQIERGLSSLLLVGVSVPEHFSSKLETNHSEADLTRVRWIRGRRSKCVVLTHSRMDNTGADCWPCGRKTLPENKATNTLGCASRCRCQIQPLGMVEHCAKTLQPHPSNYFFFNMAVRHGSHV